MIPWWWVIIVVFLDNSFIGRFVRRLGTRSGEVVADLTVRAVSRYGRRRQRRRAVR